MQTSEHTARREQRLGTPPRGRVESAQRASQRLRGAGVRQATSPGRRAALRLTPSAPLPGPTSCLDGAAADPFPRRLGAGECDGWPIFGGRRKIKSDVDGAAAAAKESKRAGGSMGDQFVCGNTLTAEAQVTPPFQIGW
ncbi:unnamed protein product [Prorocentrum cordatum]|uniref:Uncharacterized protein n=1 Tax=Prorocentrum cordatum TaxID=2364126 RepID=A0ABN9WMQ4_9DINO|nr:unnamed protein product [Polarella glacialis]